MADIKRIGIRHDSEASWQAEDPTLLTDETVLVDDLRKLIRGDGNTYNTSFTTIGYLSDQSILTTDDVTFNSVNPTDKSSTYALIVASVPQHYSREEKFLGKSETERTTIVLPELYVNVNGSGYYFGGGDFDLNTTGAWDDTTYQTASNRAGSDFYIYAGEPSSGNVVNIVISANSTIPSGYTASTSRKIGGFHCLCVGIGTSTYGYVNSDDDLVLVDMAYESDTISGTQHWLEGYVEGDVLPFSIWDLLHRPVSSPEGMVYDPGSDVWVDIYLASASGGNLKSIYNATTADGDNGWHQYRFQQMFARARKLLPRQDEFVSFSLGSPQGENISGSADPGTTGGHSAVSGQRIVSLIGVEDATGVLWQWGREAGATNDVGSTNEDAYDTNDANVVGQHYEAPNRPRFGGYWADGSRCGSRGSIWGAPALTLIADSGGRGVSEPIGGRNG